MPRTEWRDHPSLVGHRTALIAEIVREQPPGRVYVSRRQWLLTATGRPGAPATLAVHSLTARTVWTLTQRGKEVGWRPGTMGVPADVRRTLDAAALEWIARTGGHVPLE